jgi:UDP-N-acetylglucosamine 4,6-dehydratase
MQGGEVFVPKIPSMKMTDLAKAIAPEANIRNIGIRPGEKLHEVLISEDEARSTVELADMYVVQPQAALWFGYHWSEQGSPLPEGYHYASDNNTEWLSVSDIQQMIDSLEAGLAQGAR